MRRVVLATTALMALAPLVHAQPATGSMGPGSSSGIAAPGPASPAGSMTPGGSMSAAADPTNCGTRDEPKPCGPMPRKALNHFPSKRSNGAG